MITAALFTIAEAQKQLKHPSTDEWIKQVGVEVWKSQYINPFMLWY